jgi:hypothetical protein
MSTTSSQTATQANVASSATAVPLFAASGASKNRLVFNDSSSAMYISFNGAATITNFAVKVAVGGYYEFPAVCFGGAVSAIWDTANGFARTTQY